LIAVGGPTGLAEGLPSIPGADYLSLTRGLAPAAGLGFVLGLFGTGRQARAHCGNPSQRGRRDRLFIAGFVGGEPVSAVVFAQFSQELLCFGGESGKVAHGRPRRLAGLS